jgi:hypothetical protein
MKKVILGVLFTLFATSLPAFSATPPKTGGLCTKVGASKTHQGKKFTCIKSGKKLVWSKGIAEKQKASTPSTTTTPAPSSSPSVTSQSKEVFLPWSTKFSTQVMSDKAYESFYSWVKNQSASPVNHQILIQTPSGYSPTILEDLKALDELSSRVFSQFMKKKSVTVLGVDEQWVVSQILGSGGHLRNSQGKCDEFYDPGYAVCMNRDSHLGLVVINDCRLPKGSVSGCNLALLPHEYFHLIQLNLADNIAGAHWNYGEDYAKNSFPHWFVEGSANFVASVIVTLARNSKYENARGAILWVNSKEMAYPLVDYEIRRVKPPLGEKLNSYDIGHIATEYLVASVGFQKFLDIWKDYSKTRNFYTSFENVTGRNIATFYADFESARESLGVPPVTQKLG